MTGASRLAGRKGNGVDVIQDQVDPIVSWLLQKVSDRLAGNYLVLVPSQAVMDRLRWELVTKRFSMGWSDVTFRYDLEGEELVQVTLYGVWRDPHHLRGNRYEDAYTTPILEQLHHMEQIRDVVAACVRRKEKSDG